MSYIVNTLENLFGQTAFVNMTLGNVAMIIVALVFLYLAIAKGFEPLFTDSKSVVLPLDDPENVEKTAGFEPATFSSGG